MTKKHYILSGIFLFLALEILLITFADKPISQELRIIEAQNPGLIGFFRSYTDLGKSKWYLWPSGIAILVFSALLHMKLFSRQARMKLKRIGEKLLFFFLCIAASGIITDILKRLIGRARPVKLEQDGLYGFFPVVFESRFHSMPSGHATTAFALAFALAVLLPRWRVAFFALGVFLAVSRIMVNAHFLSDVLAGGVIAYLTTLLMQRLDAYHGMFLARDSIFPIDRKSRRR
ncbi:MAG: phosphatase PAP2 family protein [Alphaproteobacteria bacterium]|nr:phosphatase PAP2 family protein [Alphaproteobacteria bacterium]